MFEIVVYLTLPKTVSMKKNTFTLFVLIIFMGNLYSQTWQVDTATGPCARYGHTMVQMGDSVYLYGGYDTNQKGVELSDLWVYNKNLQTWRGEETTVKPPARYSHSAAASSKSGTEKMYIFFGDKGNGTVYSDIWGYNPSDNTWSQAPSNSPPLGRKEHTAVTLPDGRIMIFGGLLQTGYDSHAWLYDPSTGNWEQKASFPDMFRYGQSATVIDGKVYFFGGVSYTGTVNNMWVYDPVNDSWQQVNTKTTIPPARSHYAAVSHGTEMWIIGGREVETIELNDTWKFDVNINTWTQQEDIPTPAAQLAASMAYTDIDTSIFIFGGIHLLNSINQTLIGDITITSGINHFYYNKDLSIIPLSTDRIEVRIKTADYIFLSVSSINGQIILQDYHFLNKGKNTISVSNDRIQRGIYIINILSTEYGSVTLKMIMGD